MYCVIKNSGCAFVGWRDVWWFCEVVSVGEAGPLLPYFIYEEWFYLKNHVIILSNRFWLSDNSALLNEVPLHDIKVEVICADGSTKIIGTIFFWDKINLARYIEQIQPPLFGNWEVRAKNTRFCSKTAQLLILPINQRPPYVTFLRTEYVVVHCSLLVHQILRHLWRSLKADGCFHTQKTNLKIFRHAKSKTFLVINNNVF
jgi:hypothetical protein